MKRKKERDWTPVSKPGGIYCSPACGCNCKRKDYDQAVRSSEVLANYLGKGWKPYVWENMGWHYNVSKGCVNVHASKDGSYTAYFNGLHQFIGHAKKANVAIDNAIKDAQSAILQISREIAVIDWPC